MIQPYADTLKNIDALTAATPTGLTMARSAFYLGVLLEVIERLTPEEFAECVTRAQHKEAELTERLQAEERG